MVLPHPSRWRNGRIHYMQPRNALRKCLQNLERAIVRLVVHRNDFRDFRLRRQRLNASRNHRFFIAGRDNRADGSESGHEDGLGTFWYTRRYVIITLVWNASAECWSGPVWPWASHSW